MTAAIFETSARVDDDEVIRTESDRNDWVFPSIEQDSSSARGTSIDKVSDRPSIGSATTAIGGHRKVSDPIRKGNLSPRFPSDRVTLLQQWECVVTHVQNDCVECEMHDLTDESKPVEYAEVFIGEFNHFDRELLREGAVFYWSLGHETYRTGQVRRYSELRVRRMPPLSNLKRREIVNRAKQLGELFANNS